MHTPPLAYRIDADNRLVEVGPSWDHFASANNGAQATSAHVIGRNLFDFITDVSTRQIYRQMLERIRSGRAVKYTFRCDSPDCTRLMEMQVRLTDDVGGVEFLSTTLEARPREPLQVPQADDPTQAELLQRICGWCNRLDVNGEWLEIEEALPALQLLAGDAPSVLTHGICADCVTKIDNEILAETAS